MFGEVTMWSREISDLARTVEKKALRKFKTPQEEEAARTRELILEFLDKPRTRVELAEFTGMHIEGIYRHTLKLCNARLAERVKVGGVYCYQRRNHV